MEKSSKILFIFVIIYYFMINIPVSAAEKKFFNIAPKTNNAEKWRIGLYEGGEYIDYQKIFIETIYGLMKLGWIEKAIIPPQRGEQTKEIWDWLSKEAKSNYIRFVADAHYNAGWDKELRKKTAKKIIDRLNQKKDIDLMIAMGTWAGQDLANNKHCTPTVVHSASDAFEAGIIKSVEDSGYDHVHARVDPFRYERQLFVFHNIVGFKRLGVAYNDSVACRSITAIKIIEKVAKERGFEIVRCYTIDDIPDKKIAGDSVKKCFKELVKNVDALYVTLQNGVNVNSIPDLVKIANSARIPTFSQSGSEEVKQGFLLSISQADYSYLGHFNAEIIAQIFNGAKPNELNQVFEEPPKIAINLETAATIGFNPPNDILDIADEIYPEIDRLVLYKKIMYNKVSNIYNRETTLADSKFFDASWLPTD
ncbi:MAG: ABC transporter substrate-binding protein [Desulfobacterales bacterium]|nr:ABC transporter substrate-binding protein [Desulfobacterales bacterium]